MIRHKPKHQSAFAYSLHGPLALWTDETHLLTGTLNVQRMALWAQGGGKGPRPKPVEAPRDKAIKRLVTADLRNERMQTGVIGTALPYDDMRAWLKRANGI